MNEQELRVLIVMMKNDRCVCLMLSKDCWFHDCGVKTASMRCIFVTGAGYRADGYCYAKISGLEAIGRSARRAISAL